MAIVILIAIMIAIQINIIMLIVLIVVLVVIIMVVTSIAMPILSYAHADARPHRHMPNSMLPLICEYFK